MVLFSSLSRDKFMLPSKPIFHHKLLLHKSPTGPSLWSGKEIELLITFYCSTGKYFLTNINLSTGREEGNDTIIISPSILIPNQNDTCLLLSGIPFALRELHHIMLLNHLCTYQACGPPNQSVFMSPAACTNDRERPLKVLGHKVNFHRASERAFLFLCSLSFFLSSTWKFLQDYLYCPWHINNGWAYKTKAKV